MQTIPALDFYDAALKRYPVAYESRMIHTPLGAAHVLVSGPEDAPPLILLHGAGMNALAWMRQIGPLSESFRVLAVDLPGQSGKSAAKRMPLVGHGVADWLAAVQDGLGYAKTHVLGGSLGGWVSLKFASAYPERIGKLALLAPGGITSVNLGPFMPLLPGVVTRSRSTYATFVEKMACKPVAPDVLAFLVTMLLHQRVRTAVIPIPLPDADFARITMPALIVLGAGDQVFLTHKLLPRAKALLPHAQIVTLTECGHIIPHDQPDALMEAVRMFLQSVVC